ncbi:MAG: ABC transporter permease [Stackebrandtia sp.]
MSTLGKQELEAVGAVPADTGKKALGLLATPAIILAGEHALLLYLYFKRDELDASVLESINVSTLTRLTVEHLALTAVSTVIVLSIAVPVGIILSRKVARKATPVVLALANMGQGAPAIGIVALLAVWLGIGFWPAIIALTLYSILPALRNTLVGLEQVDPALVDAGRGIGMSAPAVLFRVELPLAVPVILAGVRTTLVLNVGVAALASFIGAGGLGELVTTGVKLYQLPVLIVGSAMIAMLAMTIDWIAAIAERYLHPKGV